ncbi:MAG: (5-formylfuran-3-yl)methyl phosphate synthase [Candidatus Lokiarchaeota archaeon]|nr:(5-formylfuran-3-yl)methyl phosphate synthase [Candidatus Lokiarchaeota archaeon]
MPPIRLLVSPATVAEARQAVDGGADIVDCKNPEEGSLGAGFPWVISAIKELIDASGRRGIQLSATLGDLPDKPGTAALAATGLATLRADYIKAGVYGPRTAERATMLLDAIVKAVRLVNPRARVVAAGYADYARAAVSIPPGELVTAAGATGCDVVMVDTAIKDGKGLLDFMAPEEVVGFCRAGKAAGMEVALAGNLKEKDVPFLKGSGADIIGVRSMVVSGGDRITGSVDAALVARLKRMLA